MNKIKQILLFCMIFAAAQVNAQSFTLKDSTSKRFSYFSLKPAFTSNTYFSPISTIPANFYSKNLGFFCKKELKLEAITKIPFKFRLGSVQYNDWMEGKPNTGLLTPR